MPSSNFFLKLLITQLLRLITIHEQYILVKFQLNKNITKKNYRFPPWNSAHLIHATVFLAIKISFNQHFYKDLLQNRTGDFLYGSIENTVNKHLDFDLSKVYAFNSIVWIVPSSSMRNSKHLFLVIIRENLWILIIFSSMILGTLLWLLSMMNLERDEYSNYYMMATNVMRLFTCEYYTKYKGTGK